MAKINIRTVKSNIKFLEARANRLARKAVLDDKTANTVKNRLRLGIRKELQLPSGEKVKPFSKEWAKRRRQLASTNKTNKFFANFKSNLTFTGKFLNSFKAIIKPGKVIRYEIGPSGSHPGYKGVKGKRGKSVQNRDIGAGQITQGRDYTRVSRENLSKIRKLLIGRIRRELKLNLKV